VKIKTSK